jgi:ribosomal-protein-alanine N-acetyltransferase
MIPDIPFDTTPDPSDTIREPFRMEAKKRPFMERNPLITPRLVLRAFSEDDVPAIVRLADDPVVSRNTLRIPHPYTEEDARRWLSIQHEESEAGTGAVFALTAPEGGALMGACGLELFPEHRRAELGYWLGRDFRGKGYATEAATAVVGWAFSELGLNRVSAARFGDNDASGRVLEKLGMRQEGLLRRHVFRGGEFRDMVMYGLLREEWAGK